MNNYRRGSIPKLEQLPKEQKDALVGWLVVDRLTYDQARTRLKKEFGVTTSAAALSSFWHQICVPRQMIDQERQKAKDGKVLFEVQICLTPEGTISCRVIAPDESYGANAPALGVPQR